MRGKCLCFGANLPYGGNLAACYARRLVRVHGLYKTYITSVLLPYQSRVVPYNGWTVVPHHGGYACLQRNRALSSSGFGLKRDTKPQNKWLEFYTLLFQQGPLALYHRLHLS